MKINVVKEKENSFLKRKELFVEIEHEKKATPTKASVQHLIAKQVNVSIEHVDIKNIFSLTGMPKSTSKIFIWKEKKVDDLSKVKKKKEEKQAPKEAPKKEDKKPEKPAKPPEAAPKETPETKSQSSTSKK